MDSVASATSGNAHVAVHAVQDSAIHTAQKSSSWRSRIDHTVDAPRVMPLVTSSPWILWGPRISSGHVQLGFRQGEPPNEAGPVGAENVIQPLELDFSLSWLTGR
jgi:hypothetical protein